MRLKDAIWRPVPYRGLDRRRPFAAALIHTNGGGDHDIPDDTSLYGWFLGHATGQHGPEFLRVGAHVQVMTSGKFEQYVDTDYAIGHAYAASSWSVGIEVEDDGMPNLPMNPAQITTVVGILKQLKIPPRLLDCYPGDGLGWHRKCANWNRSNHGCPGGVREAQIIREILPRLKEDEMTPEQEKLLKRLAGEADLNRARWSGMSLRSQGRDRPIGQGQEQAQVGWDIADRLIKTGKLPSGTELLVKVT